MRCQSSVPHPTGTPPRIYPRSPHQRPGRRACVAGISSEKDTHRNTGPGCGLCEMKRNGRFTHRRTCGKDNQLTAPPTARNTVHIGQTGRYSHAFAPLVGLLATFRSVSVSCITSPILRAEAIRATSPVIRSIPDIAQSNALGSVWALALSSAPKRRTTGAAYQTLPISGRGSVPRYPIRRPP